MGDRYYTARIPFFIAPDGHRITLADLPPRNLKRWLPRHKALIVAAVRHGLLSFGEACERYDLSLDEYLSWERTAGRGVRDVRVRLTGAKRG